MTDTPSPHPSDALDLPASLNRLEAALERIAVASVAASMAGRAPAAGDTPVGEAGMDRALSAKLAAQLDGMITRLRAAIDNTEESTAWPRSV